MFLLSFHFHNILGFEFKLFQLNMIVFSIPMHDEKTGLSIIVLRVLRVVRVMIIHPVILSFPCLCYVQFTKSSILFQV